MAVSSASSVAAVEQPKERLFLPPAVPGHGRRTLDTATELARDFSDVVAYLEQGQSYFRAYQKGSHSAKENAEFLRFLEAYERERETLKKEVEALRRWVKEQSDLEEPSRK